jgi:hypothetical protein
MAASENSEIDFHEGALITHVIPQFLVQQTFLYTCLTATALYKIIATQFKCKITGLIHETCVMRQITYETLKPQ